MAGRINLTGDYGLAAAGVVFDPMTATAMAATAAAGAISASGTIAGGNYAKQAADMQQQAANYQADQVDTNATQAFASGQRQMLDTQMKTRLAISSSTARAGASGVDAGVGSPVTNVGALAQRGSYQALMDMFNGASTATGLHNQAAGIRYSGVMEEMGGEEAQSASRTAALATLAGSAGNTFKMYGAMQYPTASGRAGASF